MAQLEKLKTLLGIPLDDKSKDFLLGFTLENIEETIRNYCNIAEIPKALENIVLRMAMDLYRNESLGEEENSVGSVSSITAGDTTTSFRSTTSEIKDTLIKDYKVQLNKYRKLVW